MEKVKEVFNYCYEDKFEIEDIEQRRLYINCSIDEDVIDSIVYHILNYNRMDKDIPKENRKPIVLYLNSPGGEVTSGFGLIDAIITSKTPVYTVNLCMF